MSVLLLSYSILFLVFSVGTNIGGEKHIILSFSLFFLEISLCEIVFPYRLVCNQTKTAKRMFSLYTLELIVYNYPYPRIAATD